MTYELAPGCSGMAGINYYNNYLPVGHREPRYPRHAPIVCSYRSSLLVFLMARLLFYFFPLDNTREFQSDER